MNIRRWAQAICAVALMVTVVAASASSGATTVPPPRFGQSVDIGLVSGDVIVKPITGSSFRLGAQDMSISVGSEIDATHGEVDLRSARAPGNGSAATNAMTAQEGQFSGALFKILQRKSQHGLTELDLVTTRKLRRLCAAATVAKARRLSGRILQTLRARDKGGQFRTRGRFSAATVRGTVWETVDRCDGTLTVVHRGSVYVHDYVSGKTITVYGGHSYLVKAPTG